MPQVNWTKQAAEEAATEAVDVEWAAKVVDVVGHIDEHASLPEQQQPQQVQAGASTAAGTT